MAESKDARNGNHLYFLRMNKYESLPQMQGIDTKTKLAGSFLGNPSLNPLSPTGSSILNHDGDWIGEEAIEIAFPKRIVQRIARQFDEDFGDSKYRYHKDRGIVSANLLTPLEYHYLGIRSKLDKIPVLKSYLQSRRYRDGIREIWYESLAVMEEKNKRSIKLGSDKHRRFFVDGEVMDFSLLTTEKYPRITLDVFGKISDAYDRFDNYLFVKQALERFLAGNPYKEAIRVAFSREGFGHKINIGKINPKQFRTTDNLPKNISL